MLLAGGQPYISRFHSRSKGLRAGNSVFYCWKPYAVLAVLDPTFIAGLTIRRTHYLYSDGGAPPLLRPSAASSQKWSRTASMIVLVSPCMVLVYTRLSGACGWQGLSRINGRG